MERKGRTKASHNLKNPLPCFVGNLHSTEHVGFQIFFRNLTTIL